MAIPVNILALLAATIWMMVLGFLWFGPVFGKKWMKEMGITEEQSQALRNDPAMKAKMNKSYALMALGALVMMFTLLHNLTFGSAYLNVYGAAAGLQAGFWNWLGFVAPVYMGGVLWESKTWKWWTISAGYYLVGLLGAGTILALWV